jgi:2-(3-amino-3-carboxypropyl)histidine synthase
MEDNRDKVNAGIAGAELAAEATVAPMRLPKKRFIGRRAAAERAEKNAVVVGGSIEDTGAVQG